MSCTLEFLGWDDEGELAQAYRSLKLRMQARQIFEVHLGQHDGRKQQPGAGPQQTLLASFNDQLGVMLRKAWDLALHDAVFINFDESLAINVKGGVPEVKLCVSRTRLSSPARLIRIGRSSLSRND